MAFPFFGRRDGAGELAPRIEPPRPAIPRGDMERPQPSAAFMEPQMGTPFRGWWPALRDAKDEIRSAWWRATSRTVDAIQNSGWLAGAVEKTTASMIGDGLRLGAKPDPSLFGGEDAADEWASLVEAKFEAWAANPLECDAEGKFNLSKLQEAACRSYFASGEIVGLVPWIDRAGAKTKTKIRLLPAHRLTQETNGVDLWQGVRVDKKGCPQSYRFRLTQPLLQIAQVTEIRARDAVGRPKAFHIFSGEAGTYRGISPFTPVLKIVRQFDRLQDLTLTAAMIQTIFAATVKSAAPTRDILEALSNNDRAGIGGDLDGWSAQRAGWYADAPIDLDGTSGITHLWTGEELDLNRSETPNATYEAFARMLCREIASCLAIGYPTLTGDYSNDTYSSTRMRTAELWPVMKRRRANYPGALCQLAYECWLEEQIDSGEIAFPGGIDNFLENRTGACAADWRGPAKPQADDEKHAKAVQILRDEGLLSDEEIIGEMGGDYERTYRQIAREIRLGKKLDLPPRNWAPPQDRPDVTPKPEDGGETTP